MSAPPSASPRVLPGVRPLPLTWLVFLVSVAGLLLEMMLIRWIGTEIRLFAYLQNTILIVCFLGLGIGCFTCRQPVRFSRGAGALFFLIAIVAVPWLRPLGSQITEHLSALGGMVIWGEGIAQFSWQAVCNGAWGLLATFLIMLLVWDVFLPMGRLLGRALGDHPATIWAYSVNVVGSLLGIWLFVLLSSWDTGPLVWVALSVALIVPLTFGQSDRGWSWAALAGSVALVALFNGTQGDAETIWSPYQKLTYAKTDHPGWENTRMIMVNNIGYQALIDNSPAAIAANPKIPAELHGLSQYDLPTLFQPQPQRTLIVGAGSGNDVAGALRGGAQQVTAVEIDPAIISFGRRYHPERPYDSSRVKVVTDDARSYFATSGEKFDLIVFGLLDSHTTTSLTNARLDHYVYTRESLSRARELLADGGVMFLSFDATRDFIADRMSRCLEEVFGERPLAFRVPPSVTGWGGTIFVAGNQERIAEQLAHNDRLQAQIAQWQAENPLTLAHDTRVATDDWPYIYLPTPSVPALYFLLALLLAGLVAYGCLQTETRTTLTAWKGAEWHFFLMGAAFLLLEVQNISKASVALGNTWLVNAVIISGIMVMILLSNLVAAKFPRLPQTAAAIGLLASCLGLYFVDLAWFGGLPFFAKAAAVGIIATLPMFFSGLIFIDSFAQAKEKDAALGANLLGSLVGGLLQTVTFVTGISALLLIVTTLYCLALLCKSRSWAKIAQSDGCRQADYSAV